jgi:hypothetical protein
VIVATSGECFNRGKEGLGGTRRGVSVQFGPSVPSKLCVLIKGLAVMRDHSVAFGQHEKR